LADGLLRAKRTLEAQNVEAQRGAGATEIRAGGNAFAPTGRRFQGRSGKKSAALRGGDPGVDGDRWRTSPGRRRHSRRTTHCDPGGPQERKRRASRPKRKRWETSLKSELKRTYQSLDKSEGNNARLCVIAGELLDRYENKSVIGSLMEKEPFTQIKRVELEKLTEEYRERIEQLQVSKKE
jgi:chaperonin cofactor prefoldin